MNTQSRREFLRGTAWMGAMAFAAGCASSKFSLCGATGAPMQGFAAPPLRRVRVGVIGLGTGTKGVFWGMPWRTYGDDPTVYKMGFEEKNGDGVHQFFDEKKAEEFRLKYRHPLWKKIGTIAQEVGGHGGMDFIMDLRWAYCLQNGLPVDQDVYDLAAWCSICELSERSVRNRSNSVDFPDFTRGAWKTAPKLGDLDIDLRKLEFKKIKKDKDALNV